MEGATALDYVMHFLTFGFKVICAIFLVKFLCEDCVCVCGGASRYISAVCVGGGGWGDCICLLQVGMKRKRTA